MSLKNKKNPKAAAVIYAVLAASLYAVNIPLSRLLRSHADATMTAAFLYLGAGIGLSVCRQIQKMTHTAQQKESLTRKELPYTIAMVLLDIIAPILLMFGITKTNSANVSLLNNFEIVATAVIAFAVFKEKISSLLLAAIFLVTGASAVLSFEGSGAFTINTGSLLVLGASICWGFENNCTKMISNKDSTEIVVIKGFFSGLGSLAIAFAAGESLPALKWICSILLLGFVSYGLSIKFYIMAQEHLGAAKTSAYYSIAPFLGAAMGIILLQEKPGPQFFIALFIMAAATVLLIKDSLSPPKQGGL